MALKREHTLPASLNPSPHSKCPHNCSGPYALDGSLKREHALPDSLSLSPHFKRRRSCSGPLALDGSIRVSVASTKLVTENSPSTVPTQMGYVCYLDPPTMRVGTPSPIGYEGHFMEPGSPLPAVCFCGVSDLKAPMNVQGSPSPPEPFLGRGPLDFTFRPRSLFEEFQDESFSKRSQIPPSGSQSAGQNTVGGASCDELAYPDDDGFGTMNGCSEPVFPANIQDNLVDIDMDNQSANDDPNRSGRRHSGCSVITRSDHNTSSTRMDTPMIRMKAALLAFLFGLCLLGVISGTVIEFPYHEPQNMGSTIKVAILPTLDLALMKLSRSGHEMELARIKLGYIQERLTVLGHAFARNNALISQFQKSMTGRVWSWLIGSGVSLSGVEEAYDLLRFANQQLEQVESEILSRLNCSPRLAT